MPNHVENIISLSGDRKEIKKMLEAIKSDEYGIGSIDFNKIIPMPKSLNIMAVPAAERGYKMYKEFIEEYTRSGTVNMDSVLHVPQSMENEYLKQHPDVDRSEFELGSVAFRNMTQYGATNWYDWSIINWGTKWNAYGYDSGIDYSANDDLQFQTAWSPPHPILEKLSSMYPNITVRHQWADEDLGMNCGERTYLEGEVIEEFIPEGFNAMQFAMDVWDYNPSELGLALNKTGTGYVSMYEDEYQLIDLFGKPALFSNDRLSDADIPEGLYCYHLRESDDGSRFCSIEPKVGVNHGGSVITAEPLDFGESGYISFTDDTAPNFLSYNLSLEEYTQGDFINEAIKYCHINK